MSRQQSPFAALTGAEKQIRWLEYQSIRLPYVDAPLERPNENSKESEPLQPTEKQTSRNISLPEPPPEIPRSLPADYFKTRHSQYDAVIARLKQAELQTRGTQSQSFQ